MRHTVSAKSQYSRMFHGHASRFTAGQDKRSTLFTTQLHRLHQEIAEVDMTAQMTFKEQQRFCDHELQRFWIEHAETFHMFLRTADRKFSSDEVNRQSRFDAKQGVRAGKFEEAQSARRGTFEQKVRTVKRTAVEAEARRSKEFLSWKESKMHEMERNLMKWQRTFAKDDEERNRMVKDL